MLLIYILRQEAEGVAALVRAATEARSACGPHRGDLLSHVVDLSLQELSDLLELVDVGLVVGGQRIQQITHVVAQAGHHVLQLVATAFEGLPARLIREDLVDELARLRDFGDQATELAKSINILVRVHAHVSLRLLEPP